MSVTPDKQKREKVWRYCPGNGGWGKGGEGEDENSLKYIFHKQPDLGREGWGTPLVKGKPSALVAEK